MLFLNTPHNPTGKVFTREELAGIAGLCTRFDVLAISDEVYDRMVFDGREHCRLAVLPGMGDRAITLGSAGKTFSVTGWKIGWAVAPAALSDGLRKAHQWVTFAVSTPLQEAVTMALEEADSRGYYRELTEMYEGQRDFLVRALHASGFSVYVPEGTYFVLADFRATPLSQGVKDFALLLLVVLGRDQAFVQHLLELPEPVAGACFPGGRDGKRHGRRDAGGQAACGRRRRGRGSRDLGRAGVRDRRWRCGRRSRGPGREVRRGRDEGAQVNPEPAAIGRFVAEEIPLGIVLLSLLGDELPGNLGAVGQLAPKGGGARLLLNAFEAEVQGASLDKGPAAREQGLLRDPQHSAGAVRQVELHLLFRARLQEGLLEETRQVPELLFGKDPRRVRPVKVLVAGKKEGHQRPAHFLFVEVLGMIESPRISYLLEKPDIVGP